MEFNTHESLNGLTIRRYNVPSIALSDELHICRSSFTTRNCSQLLRDCYKFNMFYVIPKKIHIEDTQRGTIKKRIHDHGKITKHKGPQREMTMWNRYQKTHRKFYRKAMDNACLPIHQV